MKASPILEVLVPVSAIERSPYDCYKKAHHWQQKTPLPIVRQFV
jgi:hypothetical protein